jgi:hypothetical protein
VHALRNIHSALVPNGLLIDTQPISAHPTVTADGAAVGSLNMREWIETIRAVDERINETLATRLYELADEREFVVTSIFNDGPDCLEIAGTWQGTQVPQPLAQQLSATSLPIGLEQHVRLRLLRRTPDGA